MLKNYFITAWRNLSNARSTWLINISGLSTGMAVAILIGLWVFDELNYNKSFTNHDRLAQLYHHVTFGVDRISINDVPAPIGDELKNTIPDFEAVTMTTWPAKYVIGIDDKTFTQTALFVEPQFVSMFSVNVVNGVNTLSDDLHSVIMSTALAATILGNDPVGKTIKFNGADILTVTGVFEDFPPNSAFADVKMLLPLDYHFSLTEATRKQRTSWEDYHFQCYTLTRPSAVPEVTNEKIRKVLFNKASNDGKALKPDGFLFPMSKWHLYNEFNDGVNTGRRIKYVRMFALLGIFVLLLACINFMNLSTAQSDRRAREVGIRKVLGSTKKQLILQFLGESLLTVVLAFVAGALLAALALPLFNEWVGKKMSLLEIEPDLAIVLACSMIVTGVLAGTYPALYLAAFNPAKILKGVFKRGFRTTLQQKAMVIFQFTASVVLIVATTVIYRQIQHAVNRPVGFDREGIIYLPVNTGALSRVDYNTLRHELLSTGVVENAAISDFPITGSMSADASLTWEGKDPALRPLFAINSCSHDFPATNGFEFLAGRDFSRDIRSDSSAVIVNEMAAKLISEEDVLGKTLTFGNGKAHVIVGVIKDQVRWTPFTKQSPHLYHVNYAARGCVTIRLNSRMRTPESLKKIENVIHKLDTDAPFEYKFVDEDYARLFRNEERIGFLAATTAILAVLISCIGIYALSAFAASQRIKELGVRKVFGASAYSLWKMVALDFAKLGALALISGIPVAYFVSSQWLRQYDYRVSISWSIFLWTAILIEVIVLIVVSYHAVRAALINPVTILKAD